MHIFNSTIFKTWITDLTKLQSVVNNIKNIDVWANGATGLLNPNVVTNLSSAINGLNLQQSKLVLSTKNLTQEQMNQVLVQSGLIASENKIQGELLQSASMQSNVSLEKQKAILIELGLMDAQTNEMLASKACTKEKLLNILATKGIIGANAEAIISTLGLSNANKNATLSFGLFTKATLAQVKAQLALLAANPVTWILAVVGVIYGAVKAFDALTVSFDEAVEKTKSSKEELDKLTSEISDLNNELKTTKDRIEELLEKANSGTISLLEEDELNKLKEQNDELQREIALKEKLAEIDAKEAADNAAYSLTYKTDDNHWDDEYHAIDRIDKLQSYVDSANYYQEKIAEVNQQILDIEESATDGTYKNDSAYKDLIDKQQKYQDGLQRTEELISSVYKELSTEDDSLYYNGKPIEGYEDLINRLDTVYLAVELYLNDGNIEDTTEKYVDTIKNKLIESGLSEEISNAVAEGFSEEELTSIMSFESIDWSQCLGLDDATAVIENIKEQLTSVENADENPISISISETVTQLDELKEKFDTIDKTYSKLFDSESEIGFEDLSSINEAFADVNGIDGYIKRLQEAGQDTEAVTAVMEDLIDSYIRYSGILENVNDENRQLIIATLEEMGVVNAEAVVNGELTTVLQEVNEAKQQLDITTEKLSDLTLEEIQRLIEEGNCSEQTKNKLYELYLTQIDLNNNPIDATASINQLLRMVDASSAAGVALTQLGSIMGKIGQMKNYMDSTDGTISKSLAQNTLNILEQQADRIKSNALAEFAKNTTVSPNVQYKVTPKSNYKGGSGTQKNIKDEAEKAAKEAEKAAKEAKDVFEETVDFFEQRVKVLDNALSLLKTNLDNVTGSFAKNKLVDAELGITEEKFKNYSDALNMYTQKASEALSKLPSDIAEKVKDGAVDLTTFIGDGNEEVVEAIKDYEQWADKVADCKQELAELRTAIRQLELEKFNNIMEDFTNQFDLREDGKDLISKQIDLLKEAGQLIGESFFTTQIDQSQKQLELLENEKKQLVDQMSASISSGRVN